jgi:ubiquinone/menaquinone biosynthesis C-methylase UbiE
MSQQKLYNKKSIYSDYAKRDYLFMAEKHILETLGAFLSGARMLDMGVGAGRTSKYFAPAVKSYIGADYAASMIKECRKKYHERFDFIECDVRKMDCFKDDSFDFVLFSFNGIDSFGFNDRLTAVEEIKRVLSNSGYFFFSSHNLDWEGLNDLFSIRYIYKKTCANKKGRKNNLIIKLQSAFKSFFIYLRLKILNRGLSTIKMIGKARREGFMGIYDNSLEGKARIFYVSCNFQIEQLKQCGFSSIKAFSYEGKEETSLTGLAASPWIHYLCRINK